jgi:hypothetical protein
MNWKWHLNRILPGGAISGGLFVQAVGALAVARLTVRCGYPPRTARAIRSIVAVFRTAHSLIRITVQPSSRSARATRRSRRLLFSILLRQKSVLVRGHCCAN